MKTLTKIRIINWHYFWNETIDVKPIVFLTGVNGSGKSTLIDALEVVLLGDTTGRSFNKAAMEKSSRTLRGYLKGEIGDDQDNGFKYLRNGRFTSYIVLEFYDDTNKGNFLMGIVFDSFEDGSEEHHFFTLNDKMPDNGFVENKIPLDFKALSDFFNKNYNGNYEFFDSNRQYQDYLKRKFGGLKDKYFSLLKKATSFSPITDITSFITEYVCDPQQNIELSHLQENILQYKKLEEEAVNIKKRVERLDEIKNRYEIYCAHQENYKISQYIIEKCEIEESRIKLDAYRDQALKCNARVKEIDDSLNEFNGNLAELEERRTHIIQDKANNNTIRLTDEMMKDKRETQAKIEAINLESESVKNNLTKYCDEYINATSTLINELKNVNKDILDDERVKELLELEEDAKKVNDLASSFKVNELKDIHTLTKEKMEDFRNALTSFKGKVSSLSVSLSRTIFNVEKKIASLKDEETAIKKGSKSFDSRLVAIKNELSKRLYEKYHKNIEVDIFADLIDIKDLSWSNAIEGFLYNQKFNLFVDPKYFMDAYNILRNLLLENRFYGTSLVDQERIIEKNYLADNGSLADEIITDHEGARAYTNFLIGRLFKANSIEDARNSGNGITKECDLYRNYALSQINPRLYQESFIGRTLDERFLEEKGNELRNNISNLDVYRKINGAISKANELEVINTNEINNSFVLIEHTTQIAGYEKNIAYIDNELKQHDTTLLASLDKRLADVEQDIHELNSSKESSLIEKGNLIKEVETLNSEKIINEENIIKEKESNLKRNYDPFLVDEKALPLYKEKLEAKKTNLDILQEANVDLARLQYLVSNLNGQVVRLRRDYVSDYHLTYDPSAADNKVFDNELVEFRDVKLPEYEDKIKDSYNKATQQFKDDFIFKLRGAIEDVEDQITNLNSALKESQFGRDLYKFTVKPSQVYRRYYDMLKDDLILETGEDESKFVNKYKDVMEDLFRQIVDINGQGDKTSELMSNIDKFTDYRSYLDFDLIVYNIDTGEEQRLSKMIKKKSGGETQTPFYISVLASFAQLYHVHDEGELANTTRLIIFDEAFSKMDRSRIKEAVKLLRKFNLQVILSAPSEKVADISELVDETLVTLHDKNSSCVRLYEKVDQK
ncbi:MAG: SbcC/MukB-like Walker B domain-containing protein [Acholeplasmataceae bacterium]